MIPVSMTQGAEANHSGQMLEGNIQRDFEAYGIPAFKYTRKRAQGDLLNNRFILLNAPYRNIYGGISRSEFLYRNFKLNTSIRIECRWQETGGSVDEKFPFMYLNAVEAMPEKEVWLIVDGDGARKHALSWLETRCRLVAAKTIRVLSHPMARIQIKALVKAREVGPIPPDFDPHAPIEDLTAHFALATELRIAKP